MPPSAVLALSCATAIEVWLGLAALQLTAPRLTGAKNPDHSAGSSVWSGRGPHRGMVSFTLSQLLSSPSQTSGLPGQRAALVSSQSSGFSTRPALGPGTQNPASTGQRTTGLAGAP